MKKTALLLILLSALTASAQQRRVRGGGGNADVTKDWPKPELRKGLTDAQAAEAISAYAQKLSEAGHFSGVVLAVKDGKPLVSRAYGYADLATKTPNTMDTKFNIGSINKIFTNAAIAQLAQAGKLSLDDTVRKHLPDFPLAAADKITINQLLDHKSGMGDIFGPKYYAAPPSKLRELKDFVPLFADEPLSFEPGTSQRYSNAGYVTLGLIIERLTGQKYRNYIQKNVFDPAKLKNTGFWAVDATVSKRANGYTLRGPGGPLPERTINTSSLPGIPSSAGGAYSTAADLVTFFDALAAGKLLSPKWTSWMFRAPEGASLARPSMGVAGGAPGVNAMVEMGDGWTLVTLANYDPPSASFLAMRAREIISGEALEVGP